MYDVIIVGSGAAGLAGALYAGRYKLKTLIIEGEFGGETATAGEIANYPGVKPIDGYELMKTMREQAKDVGAEMASGWAEELSVENSCFTVKTGKDSYSAKTVIFAAGAKHRRLGLPNEKELTGNGVHYCMTCDGPLYAGRAIAIVGGGDSSVKDVNLASQFAEKIYLITREENLSAEPVNLEQMKKLGDKVAVLYETEVKEIVGEEKLEKLVLTKPYQDSEELAVDGLFVEIGFEPQVALPSSIGVALDDSGYVAVDSMMRTNIDGLYAAGDTTNHFGSFKQDITAAAMGTVAATAAYEYIKENGDDLCVLHRQSPRAAAA